MYKNQLQELAQRSCFNLPSYTCIREGPDHAPRFKATVTFNGEVFESLGYHTTLRQAEHAAAEVALNTLSKRGPTPALASRILDETGVCKNLLQETAQRAGVSLPVYTTIRSGPKHQPLFKCVVEVGGRNFVGEPAKTKKQAEKNAALAAWSSLKQCTPGASQAPSITETCEVLPLNACFQHMQDERVHTQNASSVALMGTSSRTRVRSVIARDRPSSRRDGNVPMGQFYPAVSLSSNGGEIGSYEPSHGMYVMNQHTIPAPGEACYNAGQRYLHKQPQLAGSCWPDNTGSFAQQSSGRVVYYSQATPGSCRGSSWQSAGRHQRRHSLSGMESPMLSHEAMAVTQASGGGSMLGRVVPHQQQIRGLPYQSLSERFDLNRPSLLEELQLRDEEDDWHQKEDAYPPRLAARRRPWQSQSERFEYRSHLLPQVEEVHARDEEDWHYGDSVASSSNNGNFENVDRNPGYREGWLRGEALMQSLQEQKSRGGFRAGWLQEEILKHTSAEEKGHGFRKDWQQGETSTPNFEEAGSLSQHMAFQDIGWSPVECRGDGRGRERSYGHGASLGDGLKNERSYGHADVYKDLQGQKSTLFPSLAQGASSSSSTPSTFSSLWSKSTQWWGAHIPSSTTSSAAAVLANTLGLRSASSMAPTVRVRQMVPVCSAPPPRTAGAATPHRPLTNTTLSSMEDAEESVQHVFNSLRL